MVDYFYAIRDCNVNVNDDDNLFELFNYINHLALRFARYMHVPIWLHIPNSPHVI